MRLRAMASLAPLACARAALAGPVARLALRAWPTTRTAYEGAAALAADVGGSRGLRTSAAVNSDKDTSAKASESPSPSGSASTGAGEAHPYMRASDAAVEAHGAWTQRVLSSQAAAASARGARRVSVTRGSAQSDDMRVMETAAIRAGAAARARARAAADGAPTSAGGHLQTPLDADPYGWDVSERGLGEAPLWMTYEAERMDVRSSAASTTRARKMTDNRTEIRPPMRDETGRAYATGRRKRACARVWVCAGDGAFIVNGRSLAEYFPRTSDRLLAIEPLVATRTVGAFDVRLTVRGGGLSGHAGAIRHGLAGALARYDPGLTQTLRTLKLLHRDPRMVERQKPGQAGARRKFQWIKR